jgi:hypothetical protein
MAARREAAELGWRLGERMQSLAEEILPRGRREARWWRVGSLAGEEGQSLAIVLWGARQGHWRDYASGDRGDALDLVAGVVCDGNLLRAMDWARQWLRLPEQQRPLPERRGPRRTDDDEFAAKRRTALKIWLAGMPLQRGDVVWRYLEGRGIDLARLPRLPGALRCHPGLWHWEHKCYWPAMVAAIAGADGKHCATHCTWLAERNLACEDRPMVGKAPIGQAAKRTLGGYSGGCIRLWRGAGPRSWDELDGGQTLVISEGIEDGLSYVTRFDPRCRLAVAVSLSAMLALELPPQFERVCILAQSDAPGSAAARTLDRVIERWEDQGRRVFTAARHAIVKDLNELITHPLINTGGFAGGGR